MPPLPQCSPGQSPVPRFPADPIDCPRTDPRLIGLGLLFHCSLTSQSFQTNLNPESDQNAAKGIPTDDVPGIYGMLVL